MVIICFWVDFIWDGMVGVVYGVCWVIEVVGLYLGSCWVLVFQWYREVLVFLKGGEDGMFFLYN